MWNHMWLSLCIVVTTFVGSQAQESSDVKLVYTNQGPIRGHKSPKYNVFEFYNIPYATAPVGVDKFKAPLPPPTWNETFDAIDRKIICPQPMRNTGELLQTENCLVANVHVPDTQNIENCTNCNQLPVMVLIHGGAYLIGYGAERTPNVLVNSQKIIAVTFNYRLNIHGFLCLGTEVAPGNAGMKDQVALLRWVKENIARFGGDPNQITIVGCSAGGSSVDTLILSNITDGLFHQVISESGCSLASYAVQMNPVKNAFEHAVNLLNYTGTNDTTALGEFYSSLSVESLAQSVGLMHLEIGIYYVFQPCVEKELSHESFLSQAPSVIWSNGNYIKVPTLYGYNDKEGIMKLRVIQSWQNSMDTDFWNLLPVDLQFENDAQRNAVVNAALQFYFDGAVSATKELEFIDYFTDVMFAHPISRVVSSQLAAGNNQVYLYEYGFVHNNSVPLSGDARGATHCEQISTALGTVIGGANPSEEFLEMAERMGEIYLNFIVTGNPNPSNATNWPVWTTVNSNATRTPYLLIRNTTELINANNNRPITRRMQFWDQIYHDHDIRIPIPPSNNAATLSHIISNNTWIAFAIMVFVCSNQPKDYCLVCY